MHERWLELWLECLGKTAGNTGRNWNKHTVSTVNFIKSMIMPYACKGK